ncbi:hypothetical protein NX722_06130 [Endozoicomonas gorgoniicola]|uniref:Uncharacterized protein n=1 Tax=Endozoicomonas gorgoniicola TaxID=1234144 RepID=A0ABT3MS71_9GAMM|nr:hypothetical protein [Endozoicomonas gorgoniicola]MCW7552231.1 hypothetical protein [Endozoicomonas gorgoniicola]
MAQTIQSGGISPGIQGLSPDVSPSPVKNTHASSINRYVRPAAGKRIKRPAPPPPDSTEPKTLSQRQTAKLPDDQVKTILPRPQSAIQPNAEPSSQERQLSSKLDALNNRLEQINKKPIEVQDKKTVSEHKSQIKTLNAQVKSARSTVSDLHGLIKEMETTQPPVSQNVIMRAKGKALTARNTLTTTEFKLKDAKAKLAFFNYKNKQQSELSKKHQHLQHDFDHLKANIDTNATSSKAHKVIVKFFEKQVSIAKSALNNADKLIKAENKAHENKVDMGDTFRNDVQNIQTDIKNRKLPQLTRELKRAKKNLYEARHREDNIKKQEIQQKKEQKTLKTAQKKANEQQKANQEKTNQQPQQTETGKRPTPPQQQRQEAVTATQTNQQPGTANDSRYKNIVKGMPLRMQSFLKGTEGMPATYRPLKTVMGMAKTPNDFKQALADIQESVKTSTIDRQTAARLRTELCQMVAKKMTDPNFVNKIDNTFARHMMYGPHQETMLDNYATSVQELANRAGRE